MKKILKSFKKALLLEEEEEVVLKTQCAVKPQGFLKPTDKVAMAEAPPHKPLRKSSSEPEEQSKTAAVVLVATTQCQNDTQPVKCKKEPVATGSEEKVQADEAECSFQTRPPICRETKNWNDCRLFLGGLRDNFAETDLRKVFEKYGKVVDLIIPLEKDTNKSKGYGYLEFDNKDSAQACLADHFVTVCGKKVEVKKAWPRGNPRKEQNCNKKKTKETEKLLSSDLEAIETRIGSSSKSHMGSQSNLEDSQLLYQELFNDYFKAKFFLQNLLGVEKVPNVPLSEEISKQQDIGEAEMEKILRGFYVYSEGESSTEEDSEAFSTDSAEADSIADESKSYFSENYGTNRPDQTENALFSVICEERRVCDLCRWAPSNNSTESFLAHCETAAHKQRLKERFKKSEPPDQIKNKTLAQANPKGIKNTTRNNEKEHERNEQSSSVKQRSKRQRRRKPKKDLSSHKGNQKNQSGKLALEEIIGSVEAKTEKCIKCKMCNKIIPPAQNIQVLMSNLSHHLQSKGHLMRSFRKLQEKEKILEKTKSVKNSTTMTKQTINKRVPDKNEGTPQSLKGPTKVKFRCLTCNYFCSKPKTLFDHLNSASHSANNKQTSSSESLKIMPSESVSNDLINCRHCGTYLFGCSYSINNHITKCRASQ